MLFPQCNEVFFKMRTLGSFSKALLLLLGIAAQGRQVSTGKAFLGSDAGNPLALTPASSATAENARAEEVRDALRHLWSGYRKAGWGDDEVQPISGGKGGAWGGVGMLILDTLDTLWLAGLSKEFAEGEEWVSKLNLDPMDHPMRSSFFEITIRGLSGLLSAYALSGHHVLLDKAKLLGDHLLQGFPQSDSRNVWPVAYIDVHNPTDVEVTPSFHPGYSILADVGSNVLEFAYLSQATGDRHYEVTADKIFNKLIDLSDSTGEPLAPTELDPYSVRFLGGPVSVGAMGDSYFEYLLKRYLQTGCKQKHLLSTWKSAMREMRVGLLKKSAQGFTYIASPATRQGSGQPMSVSTGMDHLSCFVGGMLAMASQYVPSQEVEDWWLPTGVEITRTCYEMYLISPSGLAPETVHFSDDGMRAGNTNFRLRPETLESLFYLHRITGNTTYRDWSWNIFQAINKNTKTEYGFASVEDVMTTPVVLRDSEETFMGAETLKYALLTQLPPTALPLDQFVLNTEAHPFPVARS
mmetsp:Transcript_126638/g.236702  ORF Transcript_126638/g.236702 Transcript_126638/m.236702 type:complete len:523 (+) Transcript_126638:36-1604(+)